MTGDGHERSPEPPRHVLDEAGLAATRGPLEHDREPSPVTLLEDRDLVADREIERLLAVEVPQAVGDRAGKHRGARDAHRLTPPPAPAARPATAPRRLRRAGREEEEVVQEEPHAEP